MTERQSYQRAVDSDLVPFGSVNTRRDRRCAAESVGSRRPVLLAGFSPLFFQTRSAFSRDSFGFSTRRRGFTLTVSVFPCVWQSVASLQTICDLQFPDCRDHFLFERKLHRYWFALVRLSSPEVNILSCRLSEHFHIIPFIDMCICTDSLGPRRGSKVKFVTAIHFTNLSVNLLEVTEVNPLALFACCASFVKCFSQQLENIHPLNVGRKNINYFHHHHHFMCLKPSMGFVVCVQPCGLSVFLLFTC